MTATQAPTPGPLSGDDVKLLVKGDLLRRIDGTVVTLMADGLPDASGGETFIGRPDADGWIFNSQGWAENPVPGATVEYRCRSGSTWALPVSVPSEALRWGNSGWSGDIVAFRLAPTAPVEASGSEREHGPKCWGGTSFSDEMAHCYCGSTDLRPQPSGETR
ncbi:hypothetical protein [Brevundimonas sp.]|uniref:hypothetical protein n=1 Tax=Brevundimonas sp. TaxID=1871086 RepID=UPI00289D70AD|nr:hypothetical protein [Brevundimonas sp.]